MFKKLYSFFIIFILITLTIYIFTNSSSLNSIINFSFDIFFKSVFPSLFPMFLISSLLIGMGIPKLISILLKKPMERLYKIRGISSFILILSMFTGFPSSAKYIDDLLDKDLIKIDDAKKILLFSFFSNPLFIINTVGILFLNNKFIGLLILLAHILGNFILGLLLRRYLPFKDSSNDSIKDTLKEIINNINNTNVFTLLFTSIKDSIMTLLSIFGTITFFLILTSFITSSFNSLFIKSIVAGIFEITSGLKYVSMLDISIKIKAYISVIMISFGGLSIHTQIMSILYKRKFSYLMFFIARVLHAIISFVVLFLLFIFLKV